MAAAGSEVGNPSSYYGILAIFNVNFGGPGDSGLPPGLGQLTRTLHGTTQPYAGVVLEPWSSFPSFFTHEMGHGYGLEHSFSRVGCSGPGLYGEYCDIWDAMGFSWGGLEFSQSAYAPPAVPGWAGPGMNAFNLDKLGFIPPGRQATIDPGRGQSSTVNITSLSAPNPDGLLTVKVPIGDDPAHYYTVEYRRQLKWDVGIQKDGVLIHEVSPEASPDHTTPLSYVIPRSSDWADGLRSQGEWFRGQWHDSAHVVDITVRSINPSANTATVTVSRPEPSTCCAFERPIGRDPGHPGPPLVYID
ncbi:MAG: hypothetical protein M3256_24615 [Actinomycetota bacterium]|nr:hypothetical protein [Actinomycetota bacterium]